MPATYVKELQEKHTAENIIGSMYICSCDPKEWMSLKELTQHLLTIGLWRGMEIA